MALVTYPDGSPPQAGILPRCKDDEHHWAVELHWCAEEGHEDSYSKRWGPCLWCGEPYVEPPPPAPEIVAARAALLVARQAIDQALRDLR